MDGHYLILFVKYPEPGKVKTRLGQGIGNGNAAALYKLFVQTILQTISPGVPPGGSEPSAASSPENTYKTALFFSPKEKMAEMADWLGDGHDFYPQNGNDLGERITDAFETIARLGARKAIIIGSDTPMLDKTVIQQAFTLLDTSDVVIGPTTDGGYYLLGLSFLTHGFERFANGKIFSGISWSTKEVFTETIDRLERSRLKYRLLPQSYDIDTASDLRLLKHDIRQSNDMRKKHLQEIYRRLEDANIP